MKNKKLIILLIFVKNFSVFIEKKCLVDKEQFVFLEDDYIIDIQEKKFYKIEINLHQISKHMDDKVFFLLFLHKM